MVRRDPHADPNAEGRHQQHENEGMNHLPPLPADECDAPSASALLWIERGHIILPIERERVPGPVPAQPG
jgi:hypothetical protein